MQVRMDRHYQICHHRQLVGCGREGKCWDSLSTKGIRVIGMASGLVAQNRCRWDLVFLLGGGLVRLRLRCGVRIREVEAPPMRVV